MDLSAQTFRTQLISLLPRLRRFGVALTGSADSADDLVQDALEKALKRESQFTPGTRLDSWMFKIMQNTWIDKVRKSQTRLTHQAALEEEMPSVAEDGRSSFPARIQLAQTREAMSRLPEDCRSELALTALEGYSYKEVSEMCDIPIGTVMSRIARARRLLINMLEPGALSEEGPQ